MHIVNTWYWRSAGLVTMKMVNILEHSWEHACNNNLLDAHCMMCMFELANLIFYISKEEIFEAFWHLSKVLELNWKSWRRKNLYRNFTSDKLTKLNVTFSCEMVGAKRLMIEVWRICLQGFYQCSILHKAAALWPINIVNDCNFLTEKLVFKYSFVFF